MKKKRKTLLSWSSGKDSAWTLHVLLREPDVDVVGLFCTINEQFNRVAMHAVRTELLQEQAKSIDLPLYMIPIPHPCSNEQYEKAMASFIDKAKKENTECFAFGDLFLEDIRRYREDRLKETGITPLFPLWGLPTKELSITMIDGGLKAVITCIDPKRLTEGFVGRKYDGSFLNDLPAAVDPCGENGEFHTFVYGGPMFQRPIEISIGETVRRDGFMFSDVLLTRLINQ